MTTIIENIHVIPVLNLRCSKVYCLKQNSLDLREVIGSACKLEASDVAYLACPAKFDMFVHH